MEYLVNRRDVDFILKDQIGYGKLLELESFRHFSTETFDLVLDQALKFAQQEIAPLNAPGDREGCRFDGRTVRTPKGYRDAYKKFADNGYIGMDVPTTVFLPVAEFMTGACVAFLMYPGLTRGAARLIESFAGEELKKTFVAKMYAGEWSGTMALTEPQAGSAVGDLKTVAVPQPDGSYKIRGGKIFISSGDHDLCENIIHLVLARIQGDEEGTTKTISLFVVPKIRVTADGRLGKPNDVKTVNIEHKMGIRGQATCTLAFGEEDDCLGYLVGEPRTGMKQMFQMMNEARLLTGLQGLAIAGTAYEHALRYAKERVQGQGKTIIHYPDVRRMLMTQKSLVEGLRALLYHVAYYLDLARHHPKAAERERYQGFADLLTPLCKAYGSDMGFRVTELAMQTYGGYGYISDYPIEQYLRDAKISSIYEGTNGIQALDFLGRKLGLRGGRVVQEFCGMADDFVSKNGADPALKTEVESFKRALDAVMQTAMGFMEATGRGDFEYPLLSATPFLHLFATVVVAYYLLDQAAIAGRKLKSSPDDAHLDGKVKTARFFVHQILPGVRAAAEAIKSGDRSALEVVF